jgi:hypothetical protein
MSLTIRSQHIEAANRIAKLPKDQQAGGWKQFRAATSHAETRVLLGRSDDKFVALRSKDMEGRDRIVIRVQPDGAPILQFLMRRVTLPATYRLRQCPGERVMGWAYSAHLCS